MRVVFVGVGALGSYFGGALAAAGHDVTLVIRNEKHRNAILQNGLFMRLDSGEKVVNPRVIAPADLTSDPRANIIVVFCKTGATRAVLVDSESIIGPETQLVSVQNGLGNADVLAQFVPMSRVIYGTTMAPGVLVAPGIVESRGPHLTQIRAATNDHRSHDHASWLAKALDDAGLPTIVNEKVDEVIWAKVAFNCAMNSLCALLELSPGPLLDDPDIRELVDAKVMECCDVAAAAGISVDFEKLQETLTMVRSEHRDHIPSMLRDVQAGRQTEIESLNGAVIAFGQQYGVETPRNQTLLALIRQREANYHKA